MSRLHWPPRPTLPGLALMQPQAAEPEHLLNPLKLGLSLGAGAGRGQQASVCRGKLFAFFFFPYCREFPLQMAFNFPRNSLQLKEKRKSKQKKLSLDKEIFFL